VQEVNSRSHLIFLRRHSTHERAGLRLLRIFGVCCCASDDVLGLETAWWDIVMKLLLSMLKYVEGN